MFFPRAAGLLVCCCAAASAAEWDDVRASYGNLTHLAGTGFDQNVNSWNAGFEQYLDMEATMQPIASRTEDHEEGLKALREKRKPEFRGE